MKKRVLILLLNLLFCCSFVSAQTSELEQRAQVAMESKKFIEARYTYIRAYEDYMKKGQMRQGVECGVKAAQLYHRENLWKEAFDLLRQIDQAVIATKQDISRRAPLHYLTCKERYQMYMKIHKPASAQEQLNYMETHAGRTSDDALKNDMLYHKAVFYYTTGQTGKGNEAFKQMADKMTATKEYDKVDEVYQTLIASGRRSYMAWKDSVTAIKTRDEINGLKQQIATNEADIADKDSSLTTRKVIIIGLSILAVALAAALIFGALVLLRFIMQTRKQSKTIKMLNENNALKAQFISNISAQLEPTLKKLDSRQPEVKALLDFSHHIQTLSGLEKSDEPLDMEDLQMQPFCENMIDQIHSKVKAGVTLKVEAPKMSAKINKEYVSHILQHLLTNAAEYTPEGGKIQLEFKKRSAHSYQFLVTDSGQGIPEEQHDEVFKAFREVRDLTKGARFVLSLHDA